MNSIGLTSVTFRQLEYPDVIALAKKAGLDGIEWGGDIHVPGGNADLARRVYADTMRAGLKVLSYGSYFRVGETKDPQEEFLPVLESAVLLHAPVIRVWAGLVGSLSCDTGHFRKVVEDSRIISDMAKEKNIKICYEYHPGTLTDCFGSAVNLVQQVGRDNLRTYWQPNPDFSHEKNQDALNRLLPYLEYIHVFHWAEDGGKMALKSGEAEWRKYLDILNDSGREHALILEFVKDNDPAQFAEDAKTLLTWARQK